MLMWCWATALSLGGTSSSGTSRLAKHGLLSFVYTYRIDALSNF